MKSRDALALTALCVTATAKPALADQWDVAVRSIGLPTTADVNPAPKRNFFLPRSFLAPKKKQPSSQELFAAALAKNDIAGASAAASSANDPALMRQLAWTLFNANRPGDARDWFAKSNAAVTSAESSYGLALVSYELKDLEAADSALSASPPAQNDEKLMSQMDQLAARIALRRADDALVKDDFAGARQYASAAVSKSDLVSVDANRLIASAALREAQTALDKGDFKLAAERAHEAAREPQLANGANSIEAWATLKAGDYPNAAKLFDAIYKRDQSPEAAQGLMLANKGDVYAPMLSTIAKTDKGPLKVLIKGRLADDAFSRNDFVTASEDPRYQKSLAAAADPWVQQTTRFNQRNGEAGRDSLKVVQSIWSAGMTHGRDLLQADIAFARADAGHGSPASSIGTPSAAQAFSSVSVANTWSPQLRWRREGKISPTVTIGASPIGGAVGAAFIGSAGMRVALKNGEGKITLFARSRGDSLLASTGVRDPATGLTWGRVIERGVEGSFRRDLFNGFSLSGSLSSSELEGERTASNGRVTAGISFTKNWQLAGFKYFAAGPFYGYESYDHNRNEFTFGNGGYFSPEEYHRIGVGLNFQTQEARRFVIRGDASVAYESVREAGVDILPLTSADPFGVRADTRNSDVSGAASTSAAYRLNERVAFVGEVAAIKSAEFESIQAALGLRYTFGDGATVTSSFLAQTPKGVAP